MAHLGFSLSPLYAQNLTRGKEILELLSLSLSHGAFCRYFFIYIIARVEECLQFKQVEEESNDGLVTPSNGIGKVKL